MDTVHQVINYLNSLPASDWTTLASYLGGSTVVASVLQVAKHKFNFAEAQKLVVLALGTLSFLAAFADFLIQSNPTLSALPFIGRATGLLFAGAVVAHRFAVSPAYYSLAAKLQKFSVLLKQAEAEQAPTTTPVAVTGVVTPAEANLAQFQV